MILLSFLASLLRRVLVSQEEAEAAFLAKSVDNYDLERRMRQLDRSAG